MPSKREELIVCMIAGPIEKELIKILRSVVIPKVITIFLDLVLDTYNLI